MAEITHTSSHFPVLARASHRVVSEPAKTAMEYMQIHAVRNALRDRDCTNALPVHDLDFSDAHMQLLSAKVSSVAVLLILI